ncbi:cbb3-type cytochrome c oxidase subunit 3 [Tropicimonas sp.]|uniref:cbb3-type cytochrome c oxidase subunit 3 n=1 Tax=Tropicimonas sp. TaxID=2067044 RepID=UPI003A83ACEF
MDGDTYSLLRGFADSWMLLFLFLCFLGVIFWVFRPGSSREQRDSANIIFRHEDAPAADLAEPNPKEARE